MIRDELLSVDPPHLCRQCLNSRWEAWRTSGLCQWCGNPGYLDGDNVDPDHEAPRQPGQPTSALPMSTPAPDPVPWWVLGHQDTFRGSREFRPWQGDVTFVGEIEFR